MRLGDGAELFAGGKNVFGHRRFRNAEDDGDFPICVAFRDPKKAIVLSSHNPFAPRAVLY